MKRNLLFVLVASFFALSSCTKQEDANLIKYGNAGYIKGTIVGTSKNGEKLNESFNFINTLPENKYASTVEDDTLVSYIGNTPIKTLIKKFTISLMSEKQGSMSLNIVVQGSSVLTTQFNPNVYENSATFQLVYYKELSSGSLLKYSVTDDNIKSDPSTGAFDSNNVIFTNFKYNETTGLVSGDFSIVVTQIGTSNLAKEATLKGSFSSKVYKLVY